MEALTDGQPEKHNASDTHIGGRRHKNKHIITYIDNTQNILMTVLCDRLGDRLFHCLCFLHVLHQNERRLIHKCYNNSSSNSDTNN